MLAFCQVNVLNEYDDDDDDEPGKRQNGPLQQTKHFLGLLGELFSQTFCLKDILKINNITRHYCLIDYDQQFPGIDHVCCRNVSFFKMAVPHLAIGQLDG